MGRRGLGRIAASRASATWAGLVAFAAEARPPVQLVFLLRFVAVSNLVARPDVRGATAATGWVLICMAIYVVNGISDLAGDRANGSARPLATGRLSVAAVGAGTSVAAVLGLLLCYSASQRCGLLAVAMGLLGLAYSSGPKLKERAVLAGASIGLAAGLTYLAGCSTRGPMKLEDGLLVLALSAWVSVASATKDFSDVAGDKIAGRRTLPVFVGLRRAGFLVAYGTLGLSGVAAAAAVATGVDVVPLVVLFAGSALMPRVCAASQGGVDRKICRRPYRVYMATQYATNCSMMVLSVAAA